ncbi:MAG: hypothetical protein IKE78_05480 [Erysipelotrichaceae bacterium]|nr:hypothetical protein [Erysipelotrichaceae bacterium]MBR2826935.1 hypothetical protein [Erysipelotrichaceae bacterium]MBR6957509.1 hypothetical protein [Erysipelotrichaceae bacterium]
MKLYAIITGTVALIIGIYANAINRGNTKYIMQYHQNNVSEADRAAYGREIARGLFMLCATMALSALGDLLTDVLLVPLGILAGGFVISMIMLVKTQRKYNGGMFS